MSDATKHQPLPVAGYTAQSDERVQLVNEGKELEERVMRYLDKLAKHLPPPRADEDPPIKWWASGRTNINTGFMQVFRAVFYPQRVKLPEDAA